VLDAQLGALVGLGGPPAQASCCRIAWMTAA